MGGTQIGYALREFARKAPGGTAIVEVGCWLGAGTAQLALGVRERPNPSDVSLHCYDRWVANEAEVQKAARFGLKLEVGEDLLPHTRHMLEPFGVPIQFHKGDIRTAQWDGTPISVYVDDASKKPNLFFSVLKVFARSWIPCETVVFLMDYDIWMHSGNPEHRCQKEFIEANPDCFERIADPNVAIFRYKRPVKIRKQVAAAGLREVVRSLRRGILRSVRG